MGKGKKPVPQTVEQILAEFHGKLQRRYVRRDKRYRVSEDVQLDSYMFVALDERPTQWPGDCQRRVYELSGFDISAEGIMRRLRRNDLNIIENRKLWFKWISELRTLFMAALYGDQNAYMAFVRRRQSPPEGLPKDSRGRRRGRSYRYGDRRYGDGRSQDDGRREVGCSSEGGREDDRDRNQSAPDTLSDKKAMRILLLTLFFREEVLRQHNDWDVLIGLKDVSAFYCLEDIEEIIGYTYGFPKVSQILRVDSDVNSGQKAEPKAAVNIDAAEFQVLASKALRLEAELERTEGMLQDLQDEFDRQIEESKVLELTEFFSRLNSDTYGSIIDELFALRRGIDRLRKESYDLPLEIRGLMIMATKLLQFVKDSHIDPMMKLHAVLEVTAEEIENCIYEGTPFVGDECKRVQVISPGWIYRDKEIQISRPKVKEVE